MQKDSNAVSCFRRDAFGVAFALCCVTAVQACSSEDEFSDPSDEAAELGSVEQAGIACTSSASCDDGIVCTTDRCEAGPCVHRHAPAGTSCGAGRVCNGRGGLLRQLAPRWFLVRDVHTSTKLTLLKPRWALSFLRGPRTQSKLRRALGKTARLAVA